MSIELGRLVQQRRHELGFSRRQLSEASGMSYPYVSQIETGDRDPSLKTLRKLAEILELPMETLAGLVATDTWVNSDVSPTSSPMNAAQPLAAGPSTSLADLYRDKVLPSVERRLAAVPPLVRLQLLNELSAQALEEIEQSQSPS